MDLPDLLRQVPRQDPQAGTDLQNDVVVLQLGEPADHAEDVLVDEEVLAELLLRANGHPSRNAAVAFASIRAASSSGSMPRSSASTANV